MKLDNVRAEIDALDNEIVSLFLKRMETVGQVAESKKTSGKAVLDKRREREVLARVTEQAGPKMENYVKILFSMLFDLSRSYQSLLLTEEAPLSGKVRDALTQTEPLFPKRAVVACQGIDGAYSQAACDKLFSMPQIIYMNTFDSVFQAVEKGLCRYGILPIENNTYGSVTPVYDLMKEHDFYIVKSVKIKIDHCVLAKRGVKLADVREIFSHEQAIGQCSGFLQKLKNVKVTIVENTAVAAKHVADSDRNDVAAISSFECAELYGLFVVDDTVQNSENNYTRFICISKKMEIYPGSDKISVMLSLPHRPGALFELLSKFAAIDLNLTKLESRPIPGRDFEFRFYFDFQSSVLAEHVLRLFDELSLQTNQFVFLGNYSEK